MGEAAVTGGPVQRWVATAVVGLAAAALATGCAGPRNALNTPASTCFRGLELARSAVHGQGDLVGVRRIAAPLLARRVPEAAAFGREPLCLVAFRGDFRGPDVGAQNADHGRYAIVALDGRASSVRATYVVERLPVRFRHPI